MKFLKMLMWTIFIVHLFMVIVIMGPQIITFKTFWNIVANFLFLLTESMFLLSLYLAKTEDENTKNNFTILEK